MLVRYFLASFSYHSRTGKSPSEAKVTLEILSQVWIGGMYLKSKYNQHPCCFENNLAFKLNQLQNPDIAEISNSLNLVSEIVHINEFMADFWKVPSHHCIFILFPSWFNLLIWYFPCSRLHLGLIQTWAARVVGLTLIIIGAMGIREAHEVLEDVPALAEGDILSSNTLEGGVNRTPGKKSVGHTTFLTGIVYGLQPDALLVILPALSLPSRMAGAAFLGMFLLGTVLAMGSYTAFVSTLSNALQERIPRITHRLTVGSSLIAIGLGLAVLVGEIFGVNLFWFIERNWEPNVL